MTAGAGGRGPVRVLPRRVGVVNSRDAVVYVSILMSNLFFVCSRDGVAHAVALALLLSP